MSVVACIGVGLAVWSTLALVLALLIGRVVRARDEQLPRADQPATTNLPPHPLPPDQADGLDERGR